MRTPDPQVGTILVLGVKEAVYLNAECIFWTRVKGKRYSAPSIKALEAAAGKALNDQTFEPARLQLESLDTAARSIGGQYEDRLRTVSVRLLYDEEEKHYALDVHCHGKGRTDTKEFREESHRLAAAVMEEVQNRLRCEEWKVSPVKREPRSIHSSESYLRASWVNPRQKQRETAKKIRGEIVEFLSTAYDFDVIPSRLRIREGSVSLLMNNGQKFRVEVSEE